MHVPINAYDTQKLVMLDVGVAMFETIDLSDEYSIQSSFLFLILLVFFLFRFYQSEKS